jgi:DNA polymerase-3 subunit gamma/tau
VQQVWQLMLAHVGPMLAADLGRVADVAISGPNTLAIRFPPRYNFLQEQCQAPDRVAHIEGVLAKITGHTCKLRIEAGSGDAAVQRGPALPEAGPSPVRPRRQRSPRAQALVERAEEVLGAQVVREDDGFGEEPANGTALGAAPGDEE